MRITKWGEYGILCSLYLGHKAGGDQLCGAAEIAEMQAIPLQYTQQILHRLKKGGIIESVRGPHGGYRLSRTPEQITLREVFAAAEGDTFELICDTSPLYGEDCGKNHKCGLRSVWSQLRTAIDGVLEQNTLAGVLENHEIINRSKASELVKGPGEGQETTTQENPPH